MSSYIVEDKTINRILAGISYAQYGHDRYAPWPTKLMGMERRDFCTSGEMDRLTKLAPIGAALQEMNEAAVHARYEGRHDDMASDPYEYATIPAPTIHQLYKSLRCLWYQCMEGDVPETDLFKAIESWMDRIAHSIVNRLDAVEAAEWG